MNTKKKIENYFKPSLNFSFDRTIGQFADEYNMDSLELLSIDRVELVSFNEIKEFGQLYYCNFSSPYFCITKLQINMKDVHKVIKSKSFLSPTTFHLISLLFNKTENESLIIFALTENKTDVLYDVRDKSILLKNLSNTA